MNRNNQILINHEIPSTMTMTGLEYLGRMAQSVPENGVIVEVGPLFGSSTWILAKNAHPSVTVYSIDTWDPAPWIDRIEQENPGCKPFSIEAFKYYVRDCPNVVAIQGWSPDIVSDWDKEIDLFFDDASHGNPGFINNLNFFVPKVKSSGIVCGDDYASGWPDIIREVDHLAKGWNKQSEIIGRVWSLVKGVSNQEDTVYQSLIKDELPLVFATTSTASGTTYDMPPRVWSGALHKFDPATSISLRWENLPSAYGPQWKIEFQDGTQSEWMGSGDTVTSVGDNYFRGIQFELNGKGKKAYKHEYQIGSCTVNSTQGRLQNSKSERQGRMILTEDESKAITAVRFDIRER